LHEYLQKYPTPEEAAKHTSDAVVSSQYFEDAVKKIKKQRETRPGEPVASLVQYR
jgi:transitional endoplasmic reticulum ATPase